MIKIEGIENSILLEHLPGAIAVDLSGTIVFMNNQCAEYMKVDKFKAIGANIMDIFPQTQMLENLDIDKPKIVFYNSFGVGISVNVPIFRDGKKVGILEYDVVQASELLYDLASDYAHFLDSQLMDIKKEIGGMNRAKYTLTDIVGSSSEMERLRENIASVARTDSTVVIFGETGTGKELVAHSIHNLSRRFDKPFVKVNSAGIPENLVESELFGYEKGAFTGASYEGRKGKLELANKGTLYLDELNHMPLSVQAKLLRSFQEGEIDKLGGEESIDIDVRLIVTTNEELEELVAQGKFRADLYYRLNVFKIEIPPLRKRKEDIPELVDFFVSKYNRKLINKIESVSEDVYAYLKKYDWPGNVRELQNHVERAVNLAENGVLKVENFENGYHKQDMFVMNPESEKPIEEALAKLEKDLILQALQKFSGNKSKTAEYLKIARPVLYKKMKRLGITERDIFDRM